MEISVGDPYGDVILYGDDIGEIVACGEDASFCRWNDELQQSECHPWPHCPGTKVDIEVQMYRHASHCGCGQRVSVALRTDYFPEPLVHLILSAMNLIMWKTRNNV